MSYHIIAWIGIGAALICAYIASQYRDRDDKGSINLSSVGLKLLFTIFALIFLFNTTNTGMMMAYEENGTVTTSIVINSMEQTQMTSVYLFWFFMTFTVIGFLYMLLRNMGDKVY